MSENKLFIIAIVIVKSSENELQNVLSIEKAEKILFDWVINPCFTHLQWAM